MTAYEIHELYGDARREALAYMQDRVGRSGAPMTVDEIDDLEQTAWDLGVLFDQHGNPVN